MPFNENHKRYLRAGSQHIDKLLAQAAANLGQANGDLLFPACVQDVTSFQRQVIADHLASFRSSARRFLKNVPITPDAPSKRASWSFRVALDSVGIALAELEPKRLSDYGHLDADAALDVERALSELQAILRELAQDLDREVIGGTESRA